MTDPIANWWKAFESAAPRIVAHFRQQDWDLPTWMQEHLGAVHPELMWEFGPAVRGQGHRLVITPETRRDLRPLVREMLRRAPAITGWEFYEYRLPEELSEASQSVQGRTSGNLNGVQVVASLGHFNLVDLKYNFPPDSFDEQEAAGIAFVATESLLGEEVLDRWIGAIEVEQGMAAERLIPLERLSEAVRSLIGEVCAALPDRPWHEADLDDALWSALECEREAADDYVGQEDLIAAITVMPLMLQNALSNFLFDSQRYSRFGERFCYLKIDGSSGLEHSDFADRSEIEEAINAALRPTGLGSVVGGGTGLRYSYIELALTDIEAAWHSMSVVLSNGRLPKRTWLLFHDADLAAQWYGLYDDTPEPPMCQQDG
ncbi:MAG TPA: hypothetical protein VFI31_23910 [Pirellulales bacterium]|nr:hypothetical protein [Pirellulales bacterium]